AEKVGAQRCGLVDQGLDGVGRAPCREGEEVRVPGGERIGLELVEEVNGVIGEVLDNRSAEASEAGQNAEDHRYALREVEGDRREIGRSRRIELLLDLVIRRRGRGGRGRLLGGRLLRVGHWRGSLCRTCRT